MASDEIVIKYRADVSALTADFNKIITAQEDILDLSKQQNTEAQKGLNSLEFAQKKRLELLEQERKKLEVLTKQRDLAFDPKVIQDLNSAITSTENNIKNLSGEFKSAGGEIKEILTDIGTTIAAVFSAKAVVDFAGKSIDIFVKAQQSLDKLKFSVVDLGGESEDAFQKLVDQSLELSKFSGFSPNAIQSSQATLKSFALTADEIQKLLPLLVDYAKFSGIDLAQAAQQVGNALQGNARALGAIGVQVDATKTKAENYKATIEGLAIFTGFAANNSETLAGKLAQEQAIFGKIYFEIGEKLTPAYIELVKVFS